MIVPPEMEGSRERALLKHGLQELLRAALRGGALPARGLIETWELRPPAGSGERWIASVVCGAGEGAGMTDITLLERK
jgi:hypothetical protein